MYVISQSRFLRPAASKCTAMKRRTLTFYAEWLPLPKEQFRIMVMLADRGIFRGNLSDICRYFLVSPQTRHRNKYRSAIEALTKQGFITAKRTGRTYCLTGIPKEEEISIPVEWVDQIRQHEYSSRSVSWEIVLKVQLWLMMYSYGTIITNGAIASELEVSESTVSDAIYVLKTEFEAFKKRYAYDFKTYGFFQRKGQIIELSAFWAKN